MEKAENGSKSGNKRKGTMVPPKVIGQGRIIANPAP